MVVSVLLLPLLLVLLFLLRRRNGLRPAKTKAEVKETLFSVVVAIAFKENSRKKKKRTKKKKKKSLLLSSPLLRLLLLLLLLARVFALHKSLTLFRGKMNALSSSFPMPPLLFPRCQRRCNRSLSERRRSNASSSSSFSSFSSSTAVVLRAVRREEGDDDEEEETNNNGDKSSYETVSNPLSYAASEREAMDRNSSLLFARLSPAWRVLLLSDGSVTRHLSLLGKVVEEEEEEEDSTTEERRRSSDENEEEENNGGNNNNNSESTRVEVISMKPCGRDSSQPEDVVKIKGPLVQREVYLRYADAKKREKEEDYPPPLVYACSWWNANALEKFMKKREETMWSNLRKQNVELYREVRRVYLGKNRRLAKAFGLEDLDEEIWARHYIFWSGGEPVTVVFEAFSPKIELV